MRNAILAGLSFLVLSCNQPAKVHTEMLYVIAKHVTVPHGTPPASIQYTTIDSLVVNTDDDMVTRTRASEEMGIRHMRSLVENSEFEEAWIFLPDSLQWIEIGKLAKKELGRSKYVHMETNRGRSVREDKELLYVSML